MLFVLGMVAALTVTSADGSKISGTLSGISLAPSKPLPAVVLVGSNGPMDRAETIGTTHVFDLYAQMLNDAGFAVFRYDNRGVGQSTSATQPTAVRRQNFIDDASAAIGAIDAFPGIDPARVYVLGFSEGADTAIGAALQGARVRGLVLVGPLSVPYAQALAEQDRSAPPGVRERDALLLALPYFQSYQGIDPRKEITYMRQPALLVRGLADVQTTAEDFDGFVNAAQGASCQITAKRFAGADHFLIETSKPALDPDAAAFIVTWLRSH